MSRFVTSCGEEKNRVGDKTQQQLFGREFIHRNFRLGCSREECKPRAAGPADQEELDIRRFPTLSQTHRFV
jgi:hypothetical protein